MTAPTMARFTQPPAKFDPAFLPQPFIAGHENWIQMHQRAWACAFKHIGHDPRLKQSYFMDEACMPDRLWQWDTCFMAMYTRYAPDVFPGIQSLDNFYSWQRPDGFISMCHLIATGEPAYGMRCNPPLYAWAEWDYFTQTGDDSRFARILPVLVKYFDWLKENRRRPPLVLPHEELTPDQGTGDSRLYWETCSGAMGLDNMPRSTHLSWTGGDICWIDLSCQQALAAMNLAKIARRLGQEDTARRFDAEYSSLKRLVNCWMWCPRSQFYHDIFQDGNFLSLKCVAGFWPLLSQIASPARADALLGHLRNPNEFWRPHPVPSISFDDPNYVESGAYWLGGVWAPTNYMVVRGLAEYGHLATAHEIACKHLQAMSVVWDRFEPHTIWEGYAPEELTPCTRKDKETWARPEFCGWSALGATSMLYENIIGVRADTSLSSLHWDLRLEAEHGINRYPMAGHRLDLAASAIGSDGSRTLNIKTPIALSLSVQRDLQVQTFALKPGQHSLRV